ncbi:MAG: ZIP family metal transporter [Betaproteobacteria bacterium]|nr:ZIP family metal transporter [Betaproteobacteria bacterium]
MTLAYIILASLAGGLISAALAALVAWRAQPRLIPLFVSYAVGALLGVVFLDLMPHIFEKGGQQHQAAAWILVGILAFFVLEKLVLWRHDHDHGAAAEQAASAMDAGHHGHGHAHASHDGHAHGRATSAWSVIIGDGFHNFTDGFAIATAFMADTRLGVVTAIAIVAHELPQELGDFLVLLNSGFSKSRALFWNVMSSLATLAGALLAYFALNAFAGWSHVFLCIAASSMIYVAIADLIPGLHRKSSIGDSLKQIALIALGVGSILMVKELIGH